MKRIILLCGFMVAIPVSAGEYFRWIDANDKVHYGEKPPADAKHVDAIKFPVIESQGEYIPYETRRAQQNFPVTLYVAENCTDYCDMARSLLHKRGIPFSEKVLKTQDEFNSFKALSGNDSVPTLLIGKTYLKGYLAEQWHSELDLAGYPKTPPYRPPDKHPAPAVSAVPVAESAVPAGL